MPFKKDFVWGSATASYQIEGAAQPPPIRLKGRRSRTEKGSTYGTQLPASLIILLNTITATPHVTAITAIRTMLQS